MGAGTVGLVAKKLGVNYVGIELNSKYIEMAEKRIGKIEENLFKAGRIKSQIPKISAQLRHNIYRDKEKEFFIFLLYNRRELH